MAATRCKLSALIGSDSRILSQIKTTQFFSLAFWGSFSPSLCPPPPLSLSLSLLLLLLLLLPRKGKERKINKK